MTPKTAVTNFLISDSLIRMCIRIPCFVIFIRMTHAPELEKSPFFLFCSFRQQRIGSPALTLLQIRATLHPAAPTDPWPMTSALRHSPKKRVFSAMKSKCWSRMSRGSRAPHDAILRTTASVHAFGEILPPYFRVSDRVHVCNMKLVMSPGLSENVPFVFYYIAGKKKSYPRNRPWRPIGLWDVKDPTLSRQSAHS
jgi:hypothetical protein